jgi:hypothetical protein
VHVPHRAVADYLTCVAARSCHTPPPRTAQAEAQPRPRPPRAADYCGSGSGSGCGSCTLGGSVGAAAPPASLTLASRPPSPSINSTTSFAPAVHNKTKQNKLKQNTARQQGSKAVQEQRGDKHNERAVAVVWHCQLALLANAWQAALQAGKGSNSSSRSKQLCRQQAFSRAVASSRQQAAGSRQQEQAGASSKQQAFSRAAGWRRRLTAEAEYSVQPGAEHDLPVLDRVGVQASPCRPGPRGKIKLRNLGLFHLLINR